MSSKLDDYIQSNARWRDTIRKNTFRTRIVIAIFFLIYICIGMLVDMLFATEYYPNASLPMLLHAFMTLTLFPFATLIMLAIAGISLLVSYTLYDKLMLLGTRHYEVTSTNARTLEEKQLYNVVEEMKIAAGLRYLPRIFIIDADYMNAFASGYSEKSAMVAITRGLMQKLTREEMKAVMAHELSHIKHLDIKLTLTASLLANLTIMTLDMLFYNAIYMPRGRSSNNRSRNIIITVIIILRYVLPIVNILLLLYLSRTRELMADAGCVQLMRDNEPLASALIKISQDHEDNKSAYTLAYQSSPHEQVRLEAYIFDPHEAGIKSLSTVNDLISTHPSLQVRLAAIGFKRRRSNDTTPTS